MAHAIWTGSISFGLVQIPVGVTSAIESAESLSFTLLDRQDRSPIGYKQVNKTTGEEVPKERRVKGYEVAKNEYVIINDEDFKRANVKATETIDIHSFVDLKSIPLLRFEKPYYLSPQKAGLKAYALLLEALQQTGKVAIATMVMRQRQYLCAIIPHDHGLILEMLRYDYELGEPEPVDVPKVTPAQVKMAITLIEGMSQSTFDTRAIKDTYHDDMLALIEHRRAHPDVEPEALPKAKRAKGGPADIMELLRASVAKHSVAKNSVAKNSVAKNSAGSAANTDEESDGKEPARRAPHRRSAKRATRAKRKPS